jgi:hypothetical protein
MPSLQVIPPTPQKMTVTDDTTLQFEKNSTYLRLDGSTRKRQNLVDQFNDPDSTAKLFLISTNAGGLGTFST